MIRHSPARRLVATLPPLATASAIAIAGGAATVFPSELDGRFIGHPTLSDSPPAGGASNGAAPPASPHPDDPPDPPLAVGAFVNFESPPIEPLAYDADGLRLYAPNTPNNSLIVLDASGAFMRKAAEIPVGLDPVSVAIRPGTGGNEVWVSNLLSDNVSVVDVPSARVVAVIDVGDEPAAIVFDSAGDHAFVVLRGAPLIPDPDAVAEHGIVQPGALVSIDASARQVLRARFLDCNTPERAVYDAATDSVVVAALHSGNNTSIAGIPTRFEFDDGTSLTYPDLLLVREFALTAPFMADPLLGPQWPDPGAIGDGPVVGRIVPDIGVAENNVWRDVYDTLATEDGEPDPAAVAAFEAQFPFVTNAEEVIRRTIDDVKDTLDHDLIVVDATDPAQLAITGFVGDVGGSINGLAHHPATGRVIVANWEPRNLVRHEHNLNGHFLDHQVVVVTGAAGEAPTISRADLHAGVPGFNDVSAPNPAAQQRSLAQPMNVVYDANGAVAYVAANGPGRVGAVDGATGAFLGLVDVGRGPRGLALDHDNDRLFVLNRTDQSISVVNVASPATMHVESTLPLFNPEPAWIRDGRDFLYSTRRSNNYASSCSGCHLNGTLDHMAWDLSDPSAGLQFVPRLTADVVNNPCAQPGGVNHPMKGPMVTMSLRGLKNHEPLHWRGDRQAFVDFAPAFDGLLGSEGVSGPDMDAFDAFIKTLEYPPTFFRTRDNNYKDPAAAQGRISFLNRCNACHDLRHDGGLQLDQCAPGQGDVGLNLGGDLESTAGGFFLQLGLMTQLRDIIKKNRSDVYNGFGLVADGREEKEEFDTALETFLKTIFGVGEPEATQHEAFLAAWQSNTMPVVGWQRLVSGAPASAATIADIDEMVHQSALDPSRCDVVARGVLDGEQRGFWLVDADAGTLRSDLDEFTTLDALIAAAASPGASLVFTAVPPGSGRRIGIDQDADCRSDGVDQFPQKSPDFNSDGAVGGADLAVMLGQWGAAGAQGPADFNDTGGVGGEDLAVLLGMWGDLCP